MHHIQSVIHLYCSFFLKILKILRKNDHDNNNLSHMFLINYKRGFVYLLFFFFFKSEILNFSATMYNHKKNNKKTDTCKNIWMPGETYKSTWKVTVSVKLILFKNALVIEKCPLQNKRKKEKTSCCYTVGKCYNSKSFLINTYWHYINVHYKNK